MDQANRLRGMIRDRAGDSPRRSGRIIAVASGKGGVGKSVVALNLAATLAGRGRRVALVDADLGLGSLDLMCGVSARWNLSHVVTGAKRLLDVLADGPAGVKLATGASGLTDLADASPQLRRRLLDEIADLALRFDEVILDTSAGLHESVRDFATAADETLVVTTPEPTAVTDAYALIKSLTGTATRLHVLVNFANDFGQAERVFARLAETATSFAGVRLLDAGAVPADPAVARSIFSRTAFVLAEPRSPAAKAMTKLADRLLRELHHETSEPLAAGSPTAAAA